MNLSIDDVKNAHTRIKGLVKKTPIFTSEFINRYCGHEVFFKAECLQKIGAFKARGASNTLSWLKEQNKLPKKVIAYSSGNHAQAVAWASKKFEVECEIFMPSFVSSVKKAATESYGATVTLCQTRKEAENRAEAAQESGAYLIPPYDHEQVICGQGTATLEALLELKNIDAIFAPCGGGGLLSGTFLAADGIPVIGAEPLEGNDAAQSLRADKIVEFEKSPDTIADGAKTLRVSERTFYYLKQLEGFYEISEEEIIKWTQRLTHLLKLNLEPTSALPFVALLEWAKKQDTKKRLLVILSGGNIDQKTHQKIWQDDFLSEIAD